MNDEPNDEQPPNNPKEWFIYLHGKLRTTWVPPKKFM
jgi:hypothetical protein